MVQNIITKKKEVTSDKASIINNNVPPANQEKQHPLDCFEHLKHKENSSTFNFVKTNYRPKQYKLPFSHGIKDNNANLSIGKFYL